MYNYFFYLFIACTPLFFTRFTNRKTQETGATCSFIGSCILWEASTNKSIDISVFTQPSIGQYSINQPTDSWSIRGWVSTETWPSVDRYITLTGLSVSTQPSLGQYIDWCLIKYCLILGQILTDVLTDISTDILTPDKIRDLLYLQCQDNLTIVKLFWLKLKTLDYLIKNIINNSSNVF